MKTILNSMVVIALMLAAWTLIAILNVQYGSLDLTSTFDQLTVKTYLLISGNDPTSKFMESVIIMGSWF